MWYAKLLSKTKISNEIAIQIENSQRPTRTNGASHKQETKLNNLPTNQTQGKQNRGIKLYN